ncbi:MAG TPA: hypothetical protein GXX23_01680 [Firmicutes bacterium]|nr:hypothetical protein [Candidatus Fermentithermobacillaceae bacterium]
MAVPKGTSIGIDLSNPVRVVAFSKASSQVVSTFTAKTPFDPGSKPKLKELASEIKAFCKSLRARLPGTAGLPMSACLLFTVAVPKLRKKEFQKAIQFEIERLVPGGSDSMRVVVREWPKGIPLPPSVKVPEGTTLHLVVAANIQAVLAAEYLMKAAGIRVSGVEMPANPASRASWWLWEQLPSAKLDPIPRNDQGKTASGSDSNTPVSGAYMPWVTHGNGALSSSEPEDLALLPLGDAEHSQDDAHDALPGANLDISLVASASEAIMYLSYGACPWLMREIPLDPDNPFVNGQILAGEITRSARFARTASKGRIDGRVTVFGASDRVSFLADFLHEQTGLPTQLWGRPVVDSDPEYGVAIGLALSSEGRAES